jgi:hypothetical protein
VWLLSLSSSAEIWCELHEKAFRALGGMRFDDALFPNLKHVGGIGTFGGSIGEVAGFDGLESIDSIGPVIKKKISGFNNITSTNFFEAWEIGEGFEKLETVGYLGSGDIAVPMKVKSVGGLLLRVSLGPPHPDPLPDLREIDRDFALFGSLFESFPFQRVTRIGGDVWIGDNGFLQTFDGFAKEATIGGSLLS